MTRSGRGRKERMDDPEWERKKGKDGLPGAEWKRRKRERRKECKEHERKDEWPKAGEEEGMQEEKKKRWIT